MTIDTLLACDGPIVVAAFYKYVYLSDHEALAPRLKSLCVDHGILGTILLASEGINGTVAGSRPGIDALLAHLRSDARLTDLEHKESYTAEAPFRRMKVRLKREIMGLGVPGSHPIRQVGQYVKPEEWNALIDDPSVLVLDTRNSYEVAVGTFERAMDPGTRTFREFPEFVTRNLEPAKHTRVAMFCTGGIRCERASSYLIEQGFSEVYHLQGGILKYLETVPPEESRWTGECYVFDERVAVDHALQRGELGQCPACGDPVSEADHAMEGYVAGISCPRCYQDLDDRRRSRLQERRRQQELARSRAATALDH